MHISKTGHKHIWKITINLLITPYHIAQCSALGVSNLPALQMQDLGYFCFI